MKIYFDNAALTPPLTPEMTKFCGNPSSPHGLGISAERTLHEARKELAEILACRESEIVFTSGGTESNNLAILGCAMANRRQQAKIFAAPWEHPSVTEPIKFANEFGFAEAAIAPHSEFDGEAGLVSIAQVSHETGDIFDVEKIAARLKAKNPKLVIHVDGAQGFCKLPAPASDLYTFSGHKIHGADGVGVLVVRGVRLVPLLHGGGQENGIRAGTENLQGITQTVAAAKHLTAAMEEYHARVAAVKAELLEIKDTLPDVHENALGETSPYILSLSFMGVKGEVLVHSLSERGIFVSMGAACRSRKKQKTTLELMGFSKERADAAVRFSFSHLNTVEEARAVKIVLAETVTQLRKIIR